jgi:hypothetical protein
VEVEMREVLKGTPDFGPHRSLTGNQNAIETRIGKIAERLDKRLAASGATINKQDILDDLQATVDNLAETSPVLVGDAGIKPKAAEELDRKLGRHFDNIMRATGTSLPKTPLARYATIGALATTLGGATFAGLLPYLAVGGTGGAIGYAVYRGAISPNTRKALSGVLRNTDRALKATKVPEMKDQLALDRAFIVEII